MKKIIFGIATSVVMVWGSANLASCYGCHGTEFEKKALGNSMVVKDMNQTAIEVSLKGYRDGTYGGPMKGTMTGQVVNKSDEEIVEMAKAIAGSDNNETD